LVRAVRQLLVRKRDLEATSGALQSVLLSSSDEVGGRLVWSTATELSVADPEELYRQRGVRKLIRRTSAASWLGAVPGAGGVGSADQPAVFSIFASALETDLDEVRDRRSHSSLAPLVDLLCSRSRAVFVPPRSSSSDLRSSRRSAPSC
jgi:hypothetical protein